MGDVILLDDFGVGVWGKLKGRRLVGCGGVFLPQFSVVEWIRSREIADWGRYEAGGKNIQFLDGVGCSNGIGWSPDGKIMCMSLLNSI